MAPLRIERERSTFHVAPRVAVWASLALASAGCLSVDGLTTVDPSDGAIGLPFLPDGGFLLPDGAVRYPDGGGAGFDASTVMPSGSIAVTPAAIDFGLLAAGKSSPASTIQFTNRSTVRTLPLSVRTSNPSVGFEMLADTCSGQSLMPSTACSVSVRWTPPAESSLDVAISLVDTTGTLAVVPVQGFGTSNARLDVSPATLQAGYVAANTTGVRHAITVWNRGGASTGTLSASIVGNYTMQINSCNGLALAPMQSCTIRLSLSPLSSGTQPGQLTVTDLSGTSTVVSQLTGFGYVQNGVMFTTPATDFGTVAVGVPTRRSFAVRNQTGGVVSLDSLVLQGAPGEAILENDTCSANSLSSGGTCSVDVVVTPTRYGTRSFWVYGNAFGSPLGSAVFSESMTVVGRDEWPFSVTIVGEGANSGWVEVQGLGVNATAAHTPLSIQRSLFPPTVTLIPHAASGYTFAGWSGGPCSGRAPCLLDSSGSPSVSISATFTRSSPK